MQRNHKILLFLPVVIGVLFCALLFDPKLNTGGDNALYIILAKSLLAGNGFTNIHSPGNLPHVLAPPGYPLILTPLIFFFSNSFIPLKLLSVAMYIGSFFLIYFLIRKYSGFWTTFFVLLFTAMNLEILYLSHMVLTEIPFLFFSLLSLFLFEKANSFSPKAKIYFIIACITSVISYYIKTVGITLIIGLIAYLIYKKEYRRLVILVVIAICLILPWIIRTYHSSSGQLTYFTYFFRKEAYNIDAGTITILDFARRIFTNLKVYGVFVLPTLILPSFYQILEFLTSLRILWKVAFLLLSLPIIGLFLYGLIKETKMGIRPISFYLFFYIGMICCWSSYCMRRYLVPVIPFMFFYFVSGSREVIRKVSLKHSISVICVAVTVILLSALYIILPKVSTNLTNLSAYLNHDKMHGYSENWLRFCEAAEWVKTNTPSDAVVLCRKHRYFYLRASRKAFCYPLTYDQNKVLSAIKKTNYVLVDSLFSANPSQEYIISVLNENRDKFDTVYVTDEPKTLVLKVKQKMFK